MEISVIVPTFNNRRVLEKTLDALQAQTFPQDDYEIVVSDDGSADGTAEMVAARRGRACVRYVFQANGGRSAARNLGARAAAGRILLFMDSDIWATPETLAAHHRHYGPGVERLGVQGRSPTHPDARRTTFMRAREVTPDLTVRKRHNLAPVHIITRNFSLLKSDFDAAGGFDESFTGYGWEDIELAMRLQARGVAFDYEPEAVGYHYHVETLDGLRKKLRQAGEGAVYFWRKHRSGRLGLFLEIHPVLLPAKWLIYRTPLVTPLVRWIHPHVEARAWLPILNECYNHLLWDAYYEGVFTALRHPQEIAPRERVTGARAPRGTGAASPGSAPREGVGAGAGRAATSGTVEDR